MTYLILSDIHSNLEALLAVLRVAGRYEFDRILLLGDLVGYAASPNPVLLKLRERKEVTGIRGNHDRVAAGLEEVDAFGSPAQEAALWTREQLTPDHRRYLEGFPRGPLLIDGRFYISHGSPLDEDDYILTPGDAQEVFDRIPFRLCFFGHTHLPGAFVREGETLGAFVPRGDDSVFSLRPGARYLVNPGSVGQPRDQNPKAAFALHDPDRQEVRFLRVAYPAPKTRERILRSGLPRILGDRLLLGL